MNMRPGLTIPLPLGNVFFGFPDFGGKIDELKEQVEGKQGELDTLKEAATTVTTNEPCIAGCREQQRNFNLTEEQFQECVKRCESETFTLTPQIEEVRKELARLKGELRKHTIAQGILMATIVYAVTRAGFLQGIGEIIPG